MRLPALLALALIGCKSGDDTATPSTIYMGHGPIAEDISGMMGDPVPYATAEQLDTFERGHEVMLRRFFMEDGLGPAYNVTFCGACHEKPVFGGGAGLYRNFFLSAQVDEYGAYFPGESAGMAGGVIRLYYYGDEYPARPEVPDTTNIIAQRNPIPFFGVGLLAELEGEEIEKRADPDDLDGDGISGVPNYDQGFVGRFGVKSQTVSIEGFIRGPLFNHLGVTTDPLTEDQKAALPVDSSAESALARFTPPDPDDRDPVQAAAPSEPLVDDDGVADPEMSTDDLFDLVSFAMLLAAPEFDELTDQGVRGQMIFDDLGCAACHTPRLDGPRGALPVYSDLLLHDMGDDLADGIQQGDAEGYEFRTQPLWGLMAVGPYLHDGRATTIEEAIALHGGEGAAAAERFMALDQTDVDDLMEFLLSLGGRAQYTTGLIAPDTPIDEVGAWGGPSRPLDATEQEMFLAGRELFDHEFGYDVGVGNPRMNGDSCRACHFEPVFGGAGPRGVNVMRHGILNDDGDFFPPYIGTILHRTTTLTDIANEAQVEANVFEHRQTPHLFGLGLIEGIPEEVILANADPYDDLVPDGISGKVSIVDGEKLSRFGWKAQVPSIDEFVRDAVTAELGMTLPYVEGMTFGNIHDNDDVPDPEYKLEDAEMLAFYLRMLGAPPRTPSGDSAAEARGEEAFSQVGCDLCHIPSLDGADGPVPLYSDLLLHEILPAGSPGIEDASATMTEFRTAPLWGLAQTAPYLHSGAADTIEQAVLAHDGEAAPIREAFEALDEATRADLLTFLGSL